MPIHKEEFWELHGRRLWIQVDNQQVAQLFSGLSKLHAADLEPLCIRVGRKLMKLLDLGWRPRTDTQPFIEWDRRCFNSLADHSANVALDSRQDWNWAEDENLVSSHLTSANAHIRICSDGACRGQGNSAAGFALVCYGSKGERRVLRRSGKQIGRLGSAFLAEPISLEWWLDTFLELVV